MNSDSIIETKGLTKAYGNQLAVDNLNFQVKEGEVFGFLGPNGAGKTTTLLMLLGLSQPSGGSIKVCGLDPTRRSKDIKSMVGYLPENVGFYGENKACRASRLTARDVSDKRGRSHKRLHGWHR